MRVLVDESLPRQLLSELDPYEQNLAGYGIGVVIVRAVTNRMEHLGLLVPRIVDAIERVRVGEVVRVLANP